MRDTTTRDETKKMEEEEFSSEYFASFSCSGCQLLPKDTIYPLYILKNATQLCFSKITVP